MLMLPNTLVRHERPARRSTAGRRGSTTSGTARSSGRRTCGNGSAARRTPATVAGRRRGRDPCERRCSRDTSSVWRARPAGMAGRRAPRCAVGDTVTWATTRRQVWRGVARRAGSAGRRVAEVTAANGRCAATSGCARALSRGRGPGPRGCAAAPWSVRCGGGMRPGVRQGDDDRRREGERHAPRRGLGQQGTRPAGDRSGEDGGRDRARRQAATDDQPAARRRC